MVYLIFLLICIFLILKFDIREKDGGKYSFYFLALYCIVLASLRYKIGGDTLVYMRSYAELPSLRDLLENGFSNLKFEPLWQLLCALLKLVTKNYFLLQVVQSIFVNAVVFWFIYKFSTSKFTTVLIYFVFCYWNYSFEILRASFALAIFLLGFRYYLRRSYFKYYCVVIICFFFHYSSIIFFILPLFRNFTLSRKNFLIFFFIVIIFLISPNIIKRFPEYFYLNDMFYQKAKAYLESEAYGTNSYRMGGYIVFIISNFLVPFIFILFYNKSEYKNSNIIPLLFVLLLLSIIKIQIPLFYRFIELLQLFYVIAVSQVIVNFVKLEPFRRVRILVLVLTVVLVSYIQIFELFAYDKQTSSRVYSKYFPYRSVLSDSIVAF